MVTQAGDNTFVYGVRNFDSAQTKVKRVICEDKELNATLAEKDSNSLLQTPSTLDVFAHKSCTLHDYRCTISQRRHSNAIGEPMNVVVPTGNFGNIPSSLREGVGVPINKLIYYFKRK